MKNASRIWHTDDFLVRIAQGESFLAYADADESGTWAAVAPTTDAKFGVATLSLVATDPQHQERKAVMRATMFDDQDFVVFGARTASSWSLDVLAGRYTNHGHTWASLREAILDRAASDSAGDPVLDGINLDRLAGFANILHERSLDDEAERALVQIMATRVAAGRGIHPQHLEPLAQRLFHFGLAEHVAAILRFMKNKTWVRHAVATELQHPRWGGNYRAMLRLLNEPFRRVSIEPIALANGDGSAFARVEAVSDASIADGPLVSVIMTTSAPGEEIFASVRSLIAQTYRNWELVVVDDASPRGIVTLLKKVSALDARIRVVRNTKPAGRFVRRNEALRDAQGELVTSLDVGSWLHPRLLEIQVRDLEATPGRLANVVSAAHVSADLSMVTDAGADLVVHESSLLFRRESALATVGFYDSVPESADLEFRKRLEHASGIAIPVLAPGVPLVFALASTSTAEAAEYGLRWWARPELQMYWSGMARFDELMSVDEASPIVAFPRAGRPFAAPATWTSEDGPAAFDLVVVFDGRQLSKLAEFHQTVLDELETAAATGMRIAFLQSVSLAGPRGRAFLTARLQDLISAGTISRLVEGQSATTSLAVVRHAGAAQGHPVRKSSINADRVVVLEDATAGDVRGKTFARPDVADTVTAWFGTEPIWEKASPPLPAMSVESISFDNDSVTFRITTGIPREIRELRLTHPAGEADETVSAPVTIVGAETVEASVSFAALSGDEWAVAVELDAGGGRLALEPAPITLSTVIMNDTAHVAARTDEGNLIVLASDASGDVPARDTFVRTFLSTSVERLAVEGERLLVTLARDNAASVSRIFAVRTVDGSTIRRRDFTMGTASDGSAVWERPLTKFADAGWQLYGTFRTPLGLVGYPITVDASAAIEGTAMWVPQVRTNNRVFVAPPVPNRITRAANRVGRAVTSRLSAFPAIGTRRGVPAETPVEKILFDATHSEPRLEGSPTVTVVMPVYNVEPYLDVAISSVLTQEFTDLELILIDDASTDNGRAVIRKYWEKDPRVRVFALDHNTIGGAGVPSNVGVRAARGEFVAFADSDDHVSPAGLARMVATAQTHESELVIGDFKTFSETLPEGATSYDRKIWDELPMNKPISAFTHPALFRLSPVPWRKLYRRSFLQEHAITYPEGDYFYEDNPLHWFVLSRAHNVVMCDEVISNHRMEREGQTMSAANYKLGAFVNHMNTILNFLATSTDKDRNVLFEAFFNYLARTNWVAKNQEQESAEKLIRFGMDGVFQRARATAPTASIAPELRARLASYSGAYPDLDLTVVVPVYNSADLLKQTVDSVLAISGITYNVILVDDGSTDDSLTIMQEYEAANANVHVYAQGNRGAGRARNSVIPLATGRYSFFLDADDVIDPEALVAAVAHADKEEADLVLTKYKTEFVDEGRIEGMPKADREIWRQLPGATRHETRRKLVAQLINYPWNRVIRTSLLHDANIFFGATVVHNDVQFHWHTIAAAQKISTLDVAIASHRKFATRSQVTNIQDGRRMAVLEALRSTRERIVTLDSYDSLRPEWERFATELLTWAKARVPESLHPQYEARRAELLRSFVAE